MSDQLDAKSEEVIEPSLVPAKEVEPVILDDPDTKSTADPSTASEDNHEQKHSGVQKRINDLTAKRYEEQRRADALEIKLANMEKAQAQPIQQVATVEAPTMPDDLYDRDAMAKYHQDMTAYSVKVGQDASKTTFEQQQRAVIEQQQKTAQEQSVSAYASNAVRDGVDMDKLRAGEQLLLSAGINPSLGDYIMSDPNGGKIVEYLHDNPADAHELLSLDPVSAGIKIANEIKPRALSTTPKVSNAPEPIPEITGGGVVEKDEFDKLYPGTEFI